MEQLTNKNLSIRSKKAGAELTSIVCNKTGKEYLWQGDPQFWGRQSPILFPAVGALWEGKYKHEGKEYMLSPHGFARDMDFELASKTETEVWYKLVSSEETLAKYPFEFELMAGYKLSDSSIEVCWKVHNVGSKPMYFQIGAHPAFNYANFDEGAEQHGYFSFNQKNALDYRLTGEKSCMATEPTYKLNLTDGLMSLDTSIFAKDALIVEDGQVNEVTLLDMEKNPQVTMTFNMPLVGLWSPPAKNAPFVCIEPWCGRCDSERYGGEWKDRDWMNKLESGQIYEKSYLIVIHS